jgi:hypothetical protein
MPLDVIVVGAFTAGFVVGLGVSIILDVFLKD